MSIQATKWAWEQSGCNGTDKLVLLALANLADATGECWPPIATLSEITCQSRPTVWRALSRLRSAGLIFDTGERRGRNRLVPVYRLCMPRVSA